MLTMLFNKMVKKMLNRRKQIKQVRKQLQAHTHKNYVVTIPLVDYALDGFKINEGVFRADIMTSSLFLARFLNRMRNIYKGNRVVDMGCGSGLQGIVMAVCGAQDVVFSDVSFAAVENTRENIANFASTFGKLGKSMSAQPDLFEKPCTTTVIQGDLFENVSGKFDFIIFNHPFFAINFDADQSVSRTMLDQGELIHFFLQEAREHLSNGGGIIMPFWHFAGETNNPELNAKRLGYGVVDMRTDELEDVHYGIQSGRFSLFGIFERTVPEWVLRRNHTEF
ncbi:MAG: methyltransferase [Candidatus Micrarchaeota archaeon]|nr:methyltransferase [Candidatus Micrarchaeota archaeon]